MAITAVATLLILLFTLFGLKLDLVTVKTHNADAMFESESFAQEVREQSGLNQNTSVFFINKNRVMASLEHAFPQMQVINIETVFPNRLVVHVAKREELFAIASQNSPSYFIVDKDFKVLDIVATQNYVSTPQNAILLEGVVANNPSVQEGDFLTLNEHQELICSLAKALLIANRSAVEQKATFASIQILTDEIREYLTNDDKTVIQLTLQDGFDIYIYSPHTYMTEKVGLMFSALPEVYPLYEQTHYMEIFEKLDNSLFCKLSLKN